jgi:molybdopterin synthase sulfur carrier subunit
MTMRVQLRFFATLREQLGTGEERALRAGTTVGALWESLVREQPGIGRVRVRFAVNERYVDPSHQLVEGDEVAFFPPVSGGA